MLQIYINKYFYVLKQQYFRFLCVLIVTINIFCPFWKTPMTFHFTFVFINPIASKGIRFGLIFPVLDFTSEWSMTSCLSIINLCCYHCQQSEIELNIIKITFFYYYPRSKFWRRTCVWLMWYRIANLVITLFIKKHFYFSVLITDAIISR